MGSINPMRLLLIEDDSVDCDKFEECAAKRKDVDFVGITGSSKEGLELVLDKKPEGVILDLQLIKGSGTGIQFLEDLNEKDLTFRPVIIVTSNNTSELAMARLDELRIDWYFCKRENSYSENIVFDTLISLRGHINHKKAQKGIPNRFKMESSEEREERIYQLIMDELDSFGIRTNYKGYKYLKEAIYLQIHEKTRLGSAIDQVARKNNLRYNSVSSGMETAINNAWDNTAPDMILQSYKAKINPDLGAPSPTEFISYYSNKIRRVMQNSYN